MRGPREARSGAWMPPGGEAVLPRSRQNQATMPAPKAHIMASSPCIHERAVRSKNYFFTGFETFTMWSYHFPFFPMRASGNSSSRAGTGTSKPFTTSSVPSAYFTVSFVG